MSQEHARQTVVGYWWSKAHYRSSEIKQTHEEDRVAGANDNGS